MFSVACLVNDSCVDGFVQNRLELPANPIPGVEALDQITPVANQPLAQRGIRAESEHSCREALGIVGDEHIDSIGDR